MRLESWLEQYIKKNNEITDLLASWNEEPAVFYQKVPAMSEEEQESCYPRIYYAVHRKEEDGFAGKIRLQILAKSGDVSLLQLKGALKDVFDKLCLHLEQVPLFLKEYQVKPWKDKDYEVHTSGIAGVQLEFHFVELADQSGMNPDPVQTVTRYLDQNVDGIMFKEEIYGQEQKIDERHPLVYSRMSALNVAEITNQVTWMEGDLELYILGPSKDNRLHWQMLLFYLISMEGELSMPDGTPMWITNVNLTENGEKTGCHDLNVSVRYGVSQYQEKKEKIMHIGINQSGM